MARLLLVASLLAILPPTPSRFCPLAQYCYTPLLGWHPNAPRPLAPYCYSLAGTILRLFVGWHPLCPVAPLAFPPPRLVDLSSVTPSCCIVLPLWLLSKALDGCNDLQDCKTGYSGPMVSLFSPVAGHPSTPIRPAIRVLAKLSLLLFWGAC